MGIDSTDLPQSFLRCMSKADRSPLGKAGETINEATDKAAVKHERELHEQFAGWLRIRSISFIHSRMDRKPTIRAGWPDFTAILGLRVCCVELKAPGGRLSAEQEQVIAELRQGGTPVLVTDQLAAAIQFTREHLELT